MFSLPQSTLVNQKIPKNKFYEKLHANTYLKELFTQQIEHVIWKHKLSPQTIHLDAKEHVQEIQIFEIELKQQQYSLDILKSIDQAIPYPILFIMKYQNLVNLVIGYKIIESDANSIHIHSYHQWDWSKQEDIQLNLLQGLDLKSIYENIIRQLLNIDTVDIPLIQLIERQQEINQLQSEIKKLKSKISKEKQFNRKVALNQQLQLVQKQLSTLLQS